VRPVATSAVFRRLSVIVIVLCVLLAIYHQQVQQAVGRWAASYYADAASKELLSQDTVQALEFVHRALDWMPDDPALIYLRAQIHARAKDWDASLADLTRLIDDLAPRFSQAYAKRAAVYQELHQLDRALQDLDRAVQLSPADSGELINNLNNRAYVRALSGQRLDEALRDVEQAIELYTSRPERQGRVATAPAAYLDTLGYIRFRRGDFEAARHDIENALTTLQNERAQVLQRMEANSPSYSRLSSEYNRSRGEIVHHRGLVLRELGKASEAHDDFKLALELGYQAPPAPD
jgi:tetratricopeptide (TPR) repeat protein